MKLINVEGCGADNPIRLELRVTDLNETTQLLNGHFHMPLVIDDGFKVTLREQREEEGEWVIKKTLLNDKDLCLVMDNYLWELIDRSKIIKMHSNSACPIVGGDHPIENAPLNFEDIEVPPQALGHVKYQLELTSEGQQVMCQEFEFYNSLRNQDLN